MVILRRWAWILAAPLATGACAEMYAQRTVGASVELAETCAAGPYCVTGAIMTQNGTPISGVRCVAEWSEDEPTLTFSDHHGLFEMSGLRSIPRKLRFEKDGFEAQPVSVVEHLRHRATNDAATTESPSSSAGVAGNAEGTNSSSSDTAASEAGTPTRLIGEGATAADQNPDELFDFGDGSTLRVFVTMRRLQ